MCDSFPGWFFGRRPRSALISLMEKKKSAFVSVNQRPAKGDNQVLHMRLNSL